MHDANRLFCFGLGYCAERLARTVLAGGGTVAGTARDGGRLASMRARGVAMAPFDRDHPLPPGSLRGVTELLISIPPDADGDPVLDRCRAMIVDRAAHLRWIGYLSTTGVYGDHQGAWVDEDTPTAPSSERSRRRVAAEQGWLDLAKEAGLPVHIFRLAGIYGPGRSVIDDLRCGPPRPIVKAGQVFSRIHVDDVAAVLDASRARPDPGRIYNVCDDEAAAPDVVTAYACRLAGLPMPAPIPYEEAVLSPMARSFWNDNKRVSNRRLHQDLGLTLRYPSYREGLTAIWQDIR